MIYLSLIQNIALLVALCFVHSLLLRRLKTGGLTTQLLSGLLFGCVALVGMMTPMTLQPGLIFDGRSIIMAVAGLFGGPYVALVAAGIAAAYRYWLGGVGAVAGVAVITGTASIGVVWHYLRKGNSRFSTLPMLYLYGLLLHLWMIGCMFLMPPEITQKVLATILWPVLLLYPPATLLVCLLFLQMEQHLATEQALQQERDNLHSLVQAVPDLLFELGLDGRYYNCFTRDQNLLAAPAEELLGKTVRDTLPPEAADSCLQALQEAHRDGQSHGHQLRLPVPAGECWFELSIARKGSESSTGPRFVVLSRDITLRKQYEKQLQDARYAAETANRAKSEFLANMSHEIRTPLNGLNGMLQLLRYTGLSPEQQEYLINMELCSKTLLELISDILDISRIEADRLELESTLFSPRQALQETIRLQESAARQKSLQLQLEPADDLPDKIKGDPLRFRQIMLNLVGNAIKFTEQGQITVTARLPTPEPGAPPLLRIEVTDSGIGIPVELQSRIFDPFEQADNSTTRTFGGSGLGLAISRRLAALMGGSIRVTSEPGNGSCFSLELPLETKETAS